MQNALARVKERSAPFDVQSLVRYFQPAAYKDRFLVKSGQHFSYLAVSDIAFFRSSDGLTQAFTFSGKKHFIDHTLDELERLLDPRQYYRVSRAMTLRLDCIRKIHPHLNGRLKLETEPAAPEEIFVSRERAGDFKTWLGG